MTREIEIRVPEAEAGVRLDVFLARSLDLSRRYARRLLQRGTILLNGAPATKGAMLRTGDAITLPLFRHPSQGPLASPDPELRVLLEQDGLVAVDKPAGLPTHPLDFDETRTALNAILARYPGMNGVGEGGIRSGVVHRLDTDTSGVLVFAIDPEAWRRAREAFSERRVLKRYVARVHGHLSEPREVVVRLVHRGARMRVVQAGGREAITRVRPLEPTSDSSLVEAEPVTGLMHQIRVTLAHLGHPVFGDRAYGSDLALGRHLLHAAEIRIEGFSAASPIPREITAG
jgi:23S rRNA pseudouridine1911/1915/1917 synthase